MYSRTFRVVSTVLVVALVWLTAGVGWAGEGGEDIDEIIDRLSEEERRQALQMVDDAEQAFRDGNFEQSIELFHEVYEMLPHPNVAYQLARAHERLGNHEMTIQYYSRYLDQNPDAEDRGRIERTIEEYEQQTGEALSTVDVNSEPAGAEIFIGHRATVPVGQTPETVTLEPGEHRLVVQLEGYQPVEDTVVIEKGKTHHVRYQLRKLEPGQQGVEPVAAHERSVAWWQPTASVGLTALGAAATALTISARGDLRRVEEQLDHFRGVERSDDNERERQNLLEQRANHINQSWLTGSVAAVSFLGAGLFTAWWLFGGADNTTTATVAPMIGDPNSPGVGVSVSGRF